jgi:hypothetical protein
LVTPSNGGPPTHSHRMAISISARGCARLSCPPTFGPSALGCSNRDLRVGGAPPSHLWFVAGPDEVDAGRDVPRVRSSRGSAHESLEKLNARLPAVRGDESAAEGRNGSEKLLRFRRFGDVILESLHECARAIGHRSVCRERYGRNTPSLFRREALSPRTAATRTCFSKSSRVATRHPSPVVLTTNDPFSEWPDVFPHAACVVTHRRSPGPPLRSPDIESQSYRAKEAKERAAAKKALNPNEARPDLRPSE